MEEGSNEMKKIIDNLAYSRGYKYSLHALIDMSIKYFNILEKNMKFRDAQYIQERILGIPEKEIDSYIVSGINKFVFYCQRHGYEKICESIIMKHYENISSKEATEEDYLGQ